MQKESRVFGIEELLVRVSIALFEIDAINALFRNPRTTARIIGALIAIAGGALGTFLLLRGMALTSDAISHTVLLGIVVAFMIMTRLFGMAPDLSSPWLIIGAAAAGVVTVILTEAIQASGLIKQDAALGLVFPFLFALAVIFVARHVDNVHMDEDAVMVGEIGVAWADTNSHPIGDYQTVVITPDDPRAEIVRRCTNCVSEGISPRDPDAKFVETCTNCGEYSPGQAYQAGFIDERPVLVFWPRSVTVTLVMAVIAVAFVSVFFKELKITTFDPALAQSLGYRTRLLNYALMVVVSLVAVAAFDAVGSILVIAFFIIPPASAYLLTDRLSGMIVISVAVGVAASYWGYDLARGVLFGVLPLPGGWDTSISASIVLMMLILFTLVYLASPRYGLIAVLQRRRANAQRFIEMVLLGHIAHHADRHITGESLREQFSERGTDVDRVLNRLRRKKLVRIEGSCIRISGAGSAALQNFHRNHLPTQYKYPPRDGADT